MTVFCLFVQNVTVPLQKKNVHKSKNCHCLVLKSDGEAEKVATLSAEAATIKKEQTTLRTELGTHKIRVAEPDPCYFLESGTIQKVICQEKNRKSSA